MFGDIAGPRSFKSILSFPIPKRERERESHQSFEGSQQGRSPAQCESVQVNISDDLCSEHLGEAGAPHSLAGSLGRLVFTVTVC